VFVRVPQRTRQATTRVLTSQFAGVLWWLERELTTGERERGALVDVDGGYAIWLSCVHIALVKAQGAQVQSKSIRIRTLK
jgi:hypothetical protein